MRVEGVKTIAVRNIKKQEQVVPVGQPIHARNPIADGIFYIISARKLNDYPQIYSSFTSNTYVTQLSRCDFSIFPLN